MFMKNQTHIKDFNIHNIVTIRAVSEKISDLENISKKFNAFEGTFEDEPDITIHFHQNFDTPGLIFIGLNNSAFNEKGFYVLSNGRDEIKARIPFTELGDKCTIDCQSGDEVPLLNYIINLRILKKNFIPLHASAFRYSGKTAVVMGWAKGGKTETLLAFANHGSEFIGDESLLISADGNQIFSLPSQVTIWKWQFKEIPDLLPKIPFQKKFLFFFVMLMDFIYKSAEKTGLKNFFLFRLIKEGLPAFKRQLFIRERPQDLFEGRIVKGAVKPDRLILILSHNSEEITVSNCEPSEISERMLNSNLYEFSYLLKFYDEFRYAFPGKNNDFIDNLRAHYTTLMKRAFGNIKSYKVLHPYPVSFEKLYDQMKIIFN